MTQLLHLWLQFLVNSRKNLCLTDFLNRLFWGKNAKNRGFSGRKKIKAAAVYLFYFNYSVMQGKFNI
jgi:hypothetical protein